MIEEQAAANFKRHLADNPYPGRGLIIGPGCGDQTRIPRANLLEVKKAVMAITG